MQFGSVESDGTTQEHILSINNQNFMAIETWSQLHNLTTVDLPLNEHEFTTMWKTLLYFRAQQISETFNRHRLPNRIIVDPNMLAPAPLVDILDSLGVFFDKHSGITHYIAPPPRPAENAPAWMNVHAALCRRWSRMMLRMKRAFTMLPIPLAKQIDDRPLMLTTRQELDNDVFITRCKHQGPTAMDGLIRTFSDELFEEPIPIADCHIRMTPRIHRPSAILEYLDTYRLEYVP